MRRFSTILLTLVGATLAAGCGTRTARESIVEEPGLQVFLRSETRRGEIVGQGYDHPKTIAPVRLAHILSRIDLRLEGNKGPQRRSAIETNRLYPIADALSAALSKANPGQQVVVMSKDTEKRFAIFDHDFLTSFLVYAREDVLYIHLHRYHWEVPKQSYRQQIREPRIGHKVMEFRVIASDGMSIVDPQAVAVFWRDPVFKRPTRTRVLPGGRVVRRQILMESPAEGEEETEEEEDVWQPGPRLPTNLTPDQLRDLADLEEQRRAGDISESNYQIKRNQILTGG